MYSFIFLSTMYVDKILWKEKTHFRENRPIFLGIWGEITENVFYMEWAASFVIFEIYVRILSLNIIIFNFTRGKFRVFRQSVKYP